LSIALSPHEDGEAAIALGNLSIALSPHEDGEAAIALGNC
jgi:hypothetical protein